MATILWGEGARSFNEEVCLKTPVLDSRELGIWPYALLLATSDSSKGQIMQTVSNLQEDVVLEVYLGFS